MAYQSTCGIPKTATTKAKSGAPASRSKPKSTRYSIPDALKNGRNVYDQYVSRCPHGIPVVTRNYYEERIAARYTNGGVVNVAKIRAERWSTAQQIEYTNTLSRQRRLYDENIRMFIPKGLEILYLIRKGVPKNRIPPWPFQQVTLKHEASTRGTNVTTRSTISTAPVEADIIADFERDIEYGNDILKDVTFPAFKTIELGLSDMEVGTAITTLIDSADKCVAPATNQPTRKSPASLPENTYDEADDVFLFGKPADCKQRRIRATDVGNRHPIAVESVTIRASTEMTILGSDDSCGCVDCLTARINESDRNAREVEGRYSREELFNFVKTQSWNTMVFAPNASGKTTARALLRANGIACFDIGAKIDWYSYAPHLHDSIMFCTDPVGV